MRGVRCDRLLPKARDERGRVQRLAVAGVVLVAARLLAQRLERRDLADHADHTVPASLVGPVDQVGPVARGALVLRGGLPAG
jgi:hypothetical protein